MRNKEQSQSYASEIVGSTSRAPKKNGGLRALTAGLVLAGSLHGAPVPQQQVTYERPATSISATVHSTATEVNPVQKVILERQRKPADSEAFRFAYESSIPTQALYDDIVSYLGEYRFKLPEYRLTQYYCRTDSDPKIQLRDQVQGKPLVEIGDNAIAEKVERGQSTDKVKADLEGIRKIEALLSNAKNGDRIIYASPPDPEYGFNYGFIYDGRVEVTNNETNEKRLHLRALRIDGKSTLTQFNQALTDVSGTNQTFSTPSGCIREPLHI